MLQTLKIKNIALIDNMTIDFEKGLNVFTGETGAGKSIIIDSLEFLLGARADKTLIRHGESIARVDGLFDVDVNNESIKNFFNILGIEIENQVLISRTMTLEGKNEIRINGEICTLSMLKEFSSNLVDIYGQHEQLTLLKPKEQLELVDNFSNNVEKIINDYAQLLSNLKQINKNIEALGGDNIQRQQEIDLLQYQINEIENANLTTSEEDDLIETKTKLSNVEKISTSIFNCESYLKNTIEQTYLAKNTLNNALSYDKNLNDLYNRLDSANLEIVDILEEIKSYSSGLNFDEYEFKRIDERLDLYKSLKRKYGNSVELILQYLQKIKDRYTLLTNCDYELNKLSQEKQIILNKIFAVANKITLERKQTAQYLQEQITNNLKKLGMENAKVCFNFLSYENSEDKLLNNGCDKVELMFSANKGEEPMPIKFVASGGEMSRFMLAVKSIVAQKDSMPTMIFDEIDSGISGLMAQAVAIQLAQISKSHQVIVITHTAQIASMADTNFLIKKIENNEKTISQISKLSEEEKVIELARFLSTSQTHTFALENAKQLITQQTLLKQSL